MQRLIPIYRHHVVGGLFLCALLFFSEDLRAAQGEQVAGDPVARGVGEEGGKSTIAHKLLAMELGRVEPSLAQQKLGALIDSAAARFREKRPEGDDRGIPMRFFRTVDAVLIEAGVIFPPDGSSELLTDALKPRTPSDGELRRAFQSLANARRQSYASKLRQENEPLYYFDCDLAAILYVAVAERLGLPVHLVELPGHNFVRWQGSDFSLNWDPNDGVSIADQQYLQASGLALEERTLFGYLETRTRERILSYWRVRCGQQKARAGDHQAALAHYREAVRIAPHDVAAANELAWCLATSPDKTVRNGSEAEQVAERLIERSRRINWLETLAAAHAEAGDFPRAVIIQQEARDKLLPRLPPEAQQTALAHFAACIQAYSQNVSYADAVKRGLIKAGTVEPK